MPIRSDVVGTSVGPHRLHADARWTMAYAAGLACTDTEFFDTTRSDGPLAHPMFPVAPEWDLLTQAAIDYGLTPQEARRGVHARHDLVLDGSLRAPVDLDLSLTVAGVDRTPAGARLILRFDASDSQGDRLWTTWLTSLYRGVDVDGEDVPPDGFPSALEAPPVTNDTVARPVAVPATAAHVYSECARIWNPIHTDLAVARGAGLDNIILHGTATMAFGVGEAVAAVGAGFGDVRGLGGSFRAMVAMPSTITVEVTPGDGGRVWFRVISAEGRDAVRCGYVDLAR